MRTILYARYSSDLQNPKSCEDQLIDLRNHCEREQWTVVGEYQDEAASGAAGLTEEARPGINKLLNRLDRGGVDQVLVEATDRLARHQGDAFHIYERVTFANARVFTLSDGQVSEITALLKGWMDATFRKELASKVRRGQRAKLRAGQSPCGIAYGYRNASHVDATGKFVRGLREIIPDQADVLRRIFREYADGMSPIMIAKRLNSECIPGPRGPWLAGSIVGDRKRRNGILQNRIYIGQLVHNRSTKVANPKTRKNLIKALPSTEWDIVDVESLRIIPQDLWDAVQARREAGAGRSFSRQQRPKRLLSGLGICGRCGSRWIVTGKERWGCSSYRNGKGCQNGATITTGQYERRVLGGLQKRMLDPELVDVFVKEFHLESARRNSVELRRRRSLESKLVSASRKIEHLVSAIAEGGAEFAEIRQALFDAKDTRAAIESELAELDAASVVVLHPRIADTYRDEVSKLAEGLTSDEETTLKSQRIIRSLISQVIVRPREAERGVEIEVSGRLASILALASGEELPAVLYAADGAGEAIRTPDPNLGKVVLYP